MTDFPDLKVKSIVSFPAAVRGGTGMAVRQVDGVFYFDLAYSEIEPITTIPAAALATTFLVLWEQNMNTYRRIKLADFKTALAGLP